MEEIDRSLTRADIQEIMGFTKNEASRFMMAFGHKTGFHRHRIIGQREFQFLRIDGRLGEWVKYNCSEQRQTVAQRKGQA